LLDGLSGRIAQGRVWSQGLQALVELKEGCPPGPTMDTLGQLTFQRFFQRYWRMGALSGTLLEASAELKRTHGLRTVQMPTRLPCQRQIWPTQVFGTADARWQAVVARVASLHALGRPVLIGTDTVADSERLAWHLQQAGLPHQVLNARHDAAEAAIVEQAGKSGCITVSTRMAGRGTDIHLDAQALQAGGLHVINCQRNESPRMDRQLLGRCARQGQPGSAETWLCVDATGTGASAKHLAMLAHRWQQWLQTTRQVKLRQQLLAQDAQWAAQKHTARHRGTASS
jgi:preprotein translocase subunit SecA